MFAVDQQPVEAGAGQQFGAVATAQPKPQADLRTPGLERRFKALFMLLSSDKAAADGAHIAVVDMEGIALACRYRTGKGAAENNLPGFELNIVRRQLVGQPATPLAG